MREGKLRWVSQHMIEELRGTLDMPTSFARPPTETANLIDSSHLRGAGDVWPKESLPLPHLS